MADTDTSAQQRRQPRFNHVAMSMPADALDETGRKEIVEFYREVFGWEELPTLTEDRHRLVLQAYTYEQFVFLIADEPHMTCPGLDHFGMSVGTGDELDELLARSKAFAARDERVEIIDRKVEDYGMLKLHSFYVRYLLPLMIEVQHFEWTGTDAPAAARSRVHPVLTPPARLPWRVARLTPSDGAPPLRRCSTLSDRGGTDGIAPEATDEARAWLTRVSAGAAVAVSLVGLSSLVVPSLDSDATAAGAAVSSQSGQRIQGFGASGGWWPNDLQHFSPAGQEQVASLLFDPSGLGLSQYRYNIGGGGVGVTTPEKTAPTFFAGPGNYDWSADPGGLGFLMLAAQHGVRTLIGFVNSAPVAWTTNDKSCGGALAPGSEAAFATYLSTVVAHLHDVDHVTLSYVSPMNEPDASQPTCRQEGMVVPVGQRAALVKAVASALNKRAPYAHVIADESSLVASQLLPEAPQWLSVPGAASSVAAIAHHTYDYPPMSVLRQVAQLGDQFKKPLWASEICCRNNRGFGYQFDPTMTSGMWLANTIWADLTQAHDSAFDWWTALSPRIGCNPAADPACTTRVNPLGRNDALLYYDPAATVDHNETIYPTKRYWALGNFSRYVRPGAVLHNVTGVPPGTRAAAFSSKSGWSIVVINDAPGGTPPTPLTLHIPTGGHALSPVTAVQTSDTLNLDPVPLPRYRGGTMSASVAPHSVTTYVLNDAPSSRRQTTAALRQQARGANEANGRGNVVQTREDRASLTGMSTPAEHVLVTGGAGFIGTAVTRRLLERGAEVTVADTQPFADPRAHSITGDLRRPEVLDRAMARRVTAIFHLAAETSVLASMSRPVEVHETNVALTLSLLERCRTEGVSRFVLASTNAVVGDVGDAVIDEDSPLRPLTPYGGTKAAAEMLLSAYSASYGLVGSAIRLTNVYGPGMQQKDSLVARVMRACRDRGSVSIYGDGNQVRDYLYIDDAVQGLLLPLDADVLGPLTIGSGTSTSVNELYDVVRTVTGVDRVLPHVAPRPGEMPGVRVRIDRARRLGFEPRTSLRRGLAATWDAFGDSGPASGAADGDRRGVPPTWG